jgi:hypothetical protein
VPVSFTAGLCAAAGAGAGAGGGGGGVCVCFTTSYQGYPM